MKSIKEHCTELGINRLCHFTQSRNLAHVIGDASGLLSRRTLENKKLPHNPTDPDRVDGRDDLICCSIEYPNTYYFIKVRTRDHLFRDWVVLYIKPDHLWDDSTWYCPCNAARGCGQYIANGKRAFDALFLDNPPGCSFPRRSTHLACSPTDAQAEILLAEPIPIESIIGMAVRDEDQAVRELCRLRIQGLDFSWPIYLAPLFFERDRVSRLVQAGHRPTETKYMRGDIS